MSKEGDNGGEPDREMEWWKSLGFEVWRDEHGNLVRDRWSWSKVIFGEDRRETNPKQGEGVHPSVKILKENKRRARWPGKGASDEEWQRFAREVNELPGAVVEAPKMRSGKGRGWTILDGIIRGREVVTKWPCGCKQVGEDYFPCGTGSCFVNPE